MKLPHLPPACVFTGMTVRAFYTEEQMREYGQLCRQQALEEAAQYFQQHWMGYQTKEEIVEAIRSFIK